MQDSISLELKNRPTAVVVTGEFLREAETQRAALGMEALEPVVIAHPLSTLTAAEIEDRVEEAVPQIVRTWLAAEFSG